MKKKTTYILCNFITLAPILYGELDMIAKYVHEHYGTNKMASAKQLMKINGLRLFKEISL